MRVISKDDVTEPFLAPLGEQIYEMIGRPAALGGTTNHSFVHVVIPPGKSSPKHFHKVSEETYYIMSGEGAMTVDDKSFILRAGQAVLIMPGEVHQIFNESPETELNFLTVSAPAWVPDDTYNPVQ